MAGIALVTGLLIFTASAAPAHTTPLCVATNFKLKDLTGKELTLKDFKGKIVALVFG